MTVFEVLVVIALFSVATAGIARSLQPAPGHTLVQCWACWTYVDDASVSWSPTKFDGHQVPFCPACAHESLPPAPTVKRLAEVA
jgi:hypothetical protein